MNMAKWNIPDFPLDQVESQSKELARLRESDINRIAAEAYANSVAKGFWDLGENRNQGEMIALMHSELSEALEAIRKPQESEKIPGFTLLEEEMADLIIRAGDFAAGFKLQLVEAISAKMKYNESRPHKHGKRF